MPDVADLYEQLRNEISELVAGLDPAHLDKPVPATPGWNIKDIVVHLAADATCAIGGDFPNEFFQAFGESAAVTKVNSWTERQLADRHGHSLEELLQEWKTSSTDLMPLMRGEKPWPEGTMPFADRILLTDITVHQQDIFGALGIVRARDSAPIKMGLSAYVVGMGWRLSAANLPPLRFEVEDKSYTAGEGEPGATVRGSCYELFRAMSGRRSPEQIAAYDWDGEAEPYIPYFYPYGIREESLVE